MSMTNAKRVITAALDDAERWVMEGIAARDAEIAELRDKLNSEHCKDCCCARSWEALGNPPYSGVSIPQHIEQLKAQLQRAREASMSEIDGLISNFEEARIFRGRPTGEETWQQGFRQAVLWGLQGYAQAMQEAHDGRFPCGEFCKHDNWTDDDWLREAARQKGIEL
jgi:hypothetical protein